MKPQPTEGCNALMNSDREAPNFAKLRGIFFDCEKVSNGYKDVFMETDRFNNKGSLNKEQKIGT